MLGLSKRNTSADAEQLICPLCVLIEHLRSVKCPLLPVLQHISSSRGNCGVLQNIWGFHDLKCCNYEIADYVLAVL